MRIRRIQIDSWRHFQNIQLTLDDNSGLVCVVGANGTGKSHLLELISASAHRIGLSPGIDLPRGDPFSDIHRFSLTFHIAVGVSNSIDQGLANNPSYAAWDRTLTIESEKAGEQVHTTIEAGGIADQRSRVACASLVVDRLRNTRDVHFLSLDADRAYPNRDVNMHQVVEAYGIDWETAEYTRGRSFRSSSTLYDEWKRYFLARENQAATHHVKEIRRARVAKGKEPAFSDHFEPYKNALLRVLPHVVFTGVDTNKRSLLFDTTGLELSFNQLSGGEREIAFLVGQIERFGLRHGLFLIDEPELHLNADLIRTWVAYLTGTVSSGQIWLATHSLEAVEAAGQQATFVLERNEETRKVSSVARLDTRPILSALSRAVGTPAFSISQLLFVFVEGEESVGERERYRKLAGLPQTVRFMECGSCNEVFRRVAAIKTLSHEAQAIIRVGGVVDRDFRTSAEIERIAKEQGIFGLPVHEVENFFLHPGTLAVLLTQNGCSELRPTDLVRSAADDRAGSWVFQHAMATPNAKSLPQMPPYAKEVAKVAEWVQFEADREAVVGRILSATGFDVESQSRLRTILNVSVDIYSRKRREDSFWKECEGKQVLNDVAQAAGFSGAPALSQAAFAAWSRYGATIPDELTEFRRYLHSL